MSTTNTVLQHVFENHAEMISKIARREHRGVQTIEVDDIEQHIWEMIGKWSLRDDRGTDFRTWDEKGIADLAIRVARKYVARERIEYMHFAGAFIYTPAIVEGYLKVCVWTELEDVPDIDGRVDVVEAVKSLPLNIQRELFVTYGLDQPYPNAHAARKRVERAVETISDRLNMGSGAKIGDMADAA